MNSVQKDIHMPRTPRRGRDELRQATLDAARIIIESEGPEGLTARRLAAAVGYTPGTIYNLFNNLSEVLWEVNRQNFASLAGLFAQLEGPDPETRLRRLASLYLQLISEQPALFRALFEGPRRSENFPAWYTDAISGLLDRIAIEIRILAPSLTETRARHEADCLYTGIHGIAALYASGRLDMISSATADDLAANLLTRCLRDIASEEASLQAASKAVGHG